MKLDEARKMVENLSRGIDPYIGRELPIQDVCADPDVQEALSIVLEYCTIESNDQRRERKKAEKIVERELRNQERHLKYPNGGKPWTSNEITDLLNLHDKRFNIYQIASIMKRTPAAIKKQLKNLGKTPLSVYAPKGAKFLQK